MEIKARNLKITISCYHFKMFCRFQVPKLAKENIRLLSLFFIFMSTNKVHKKTIFSLPVNLEELNEITAGPFFFS